MQTIPFWTWDGSPPWENPDCITVDNTGFLLDEITDDIIQTGQFRNPVTLQLFSNEARQLILERASLKYPAKHPKLVTIAQSTQQSTKNKYPHISEMTWYVMRDCLTHSLRFGSDFISHESLFTFLNRFLRIRIRDESRIHFLMYLRHMETNSAAEFRNFQEIQLPGFDGTSLHTAFIDVNRGTACEVAFSRRVDQLLKEDAPHIPPSNPPFTYIGYWQKIKDQGHWNPHRFVPPSPSKKVVIALAITGLLVAAAFAVSCIFCPPLAFLIAGIALKVGASTGLCIAAGGVLTGLPFWIAAARKARSLHSKAAPHA